MNKFVTSALALATAGSVAWAGTDDEEWLGLDQELNSLSSTVAAQDGGVDIGALIRSSYAQIDDDLTGPPDQAGFEFQDVDVWLEGEIGDFDWRVSVDFDGGGQGGGAALEDAYANWNFSEEIGLAWGQFKSPLLLSQMVDPENTLFIDRSLMGARFDGWDLGAKLHGSYEDQFSWMIAIQNGSDGQADEYRFSARGEYMIGGGASGRNGVEGCYGASDEFAATIGIGWTQDDGLGALADDNTVFALDGAGTIGDFGGGFELVNLDEDLVNGVDSATAWALYGSWMLSPDEWEIGLRYEDDDDLNDMTRITAGVNWYHQGHNSKWSLNVSNIDFDVPGGADGTNIELGLTIGGTRS